MQAAQEPALSGAAALWQREAMQPVTYKRRRSVLSRGEREWRIEPDALVMRTPAGAEKATPWRDIVSVRLCQEPARGRPWRYVFELQPRNQRRIRIDNAHSVGRRQYEDRSASYTPFVRAALARIAEHNPKACALMGETPKRYFLLLLGALLALGVLAFLLAAVRTPIDALPAPYAALAKLVIILLMLPIFWRWVIGAMPRGVPITELPPRTLPPET